MSDMLQQAVVDAAALREAALQKAQTLVLEKYANNIREAVEQILERVPEEQPMPMGANASLAGGTAEEQNGSEELSKPEVTPGVFDGERLCDCPDNNEVIELDFADLQAEIAKGAEPGPGSEEPHTEAAEDIMGLKENVMASGAVEGAAESTKPIEELMRPAAMEEKCDECESPKLEECACSEREPISPAPQPASPVAIQGESEEMLTEEDIALLEGYYDAFYGDDSAESPESEELKTTEETPIQETVVVDHQPVPSGKSAFHSGTEAELAEEAEKNLAALQHDTEMKEELAELKKEVSSLQETRKYLISKEQQYLKTIKDISGQLSESNIRNARLLYCNKALVDSSLNERQKQKLAEAICKAKTVEETKTLYEALRETLRAITEPNREMATRNKPLREALVRDRTSMVSRESKEADPFWVAQKRLAGIKKEEKEN
jgi:hypothetical protein